MAGDADLETRGVVIVEEDIISLATGGLFWVDEEFNKADPFPEAFSGSGETSEAPSTWVGTGLAG